MSVVLSEVNNRMIYIPPGFAHGFLVLSDMADVLYKCTVAYSPDDDRGIIWNDPEIGISWPIRDPLLSPKDVRHPWLRTSDNNLEYGR
jgi:dTDP-4-dehydrorhamnose 3,5-epimerase